MSQQFSEVRVGNTSRSTFDLSHHQVTTSDFGYLIPICVRDMVPNDDFVVKPSLFCRLAPLAVPTYGRIQCRVHSFFVPYRILYPHWSEFITQAQGNNTIPPYFTTSVLRQAIAADPQYSDSALVGVERGIYGRLMSNLGLNPYFFLNDSGLSSTDRISAFRFLAYYRIWMDWYMDSNIYNHSNMVSAFNELIKDGGSLVANATEMLKTRHACFGKDYFTTAKLHPQDGAASQVGVHVNPDIMLQTDASGATANVISYRGSSSSPSTIGVASNRKSELVGQFTVEELRAANSLQRYLERNNYVGSKVINQLLAHFGIAPTPERLDMSEYIGGSNFPIQIGDVTSTNFDLGTEKISTLGAQAGKGIGAAQSETVRYHATEHGVFMTLLSILPETAYYQGLDKQWQLGVTGDALDFYTPEFENLGYQEILNKEVFIPSEITGIYQNYDPDGIFGYSPRYAFLKFQRDILAGDFIGEPVTLYDGSYSPNDSWHLFRLLSYTDESPLALNENFVECSRENYDRIFQFDHPSVDHFYFNIDVDVKATRPMVGFMEPSLDENNRVDGNTINLPYGGTRL